MAGTGSSSGGGLRLAVALFVIFALVCFLGIQDLRAQRDRGLKNAELDTIFRELQDARKSQEELQRLVSDLTAEKLELTLVKSNTSTMLMETEHKKQVLLEEKTKLEAALGDKDGQISTLKDQVKDFAHSEKEVARLRSHLKTLEEQLELYKANATGDGRGSVSRQQEQEQQAEAEAALEAAKPQGEDPDHGLVAADKAEVGVTEADTDLDVKGEEVDDRKREQLDGESDKVDEDLDAAKTLNQEA